jgi:hypothetical protein
MDSETEKKWDWENENLILINIGDQTESIVSEQIFDLINMNNCLGMIKNHSERKIGYIKGTDFDKSCRK